MNNHFLLTITKLHLMSIWNAIVMVTVKLQLPVKFWGIFGVNNWFCFKYRIYSINNKHHQLNEKGKKKVLKDFFYFTKAQSFSCDSFFYVLVIIHSCGSYKLCFSKKKKKICKYIKIDICKNSFQALTLFNYTCNCIIMLFDVQHQWCQKRFHWSQFFWIVLSWIYIASNKSFLNHASRLFSDLQIRHMHQKSPLLKCSGKC